jgi:hypothetical protein
MEVSGQLHEPATLPLEKFLLSPLDRRLVDFRSALDAVTKREIDCLCRESNSNGPVCSLIITLTEILWLPYIRLFKTLFDIAYVKHEEKHL